MVRRNTNQRQIVFDTIQSMGHITSEDLIEKITKEHDDISLASIYRNLGILLEEHKIKKVKLEQKDVLETVKEKHYHFECKECLKVYDIKVEKMPLNKEELSNTINEDIEDYDIVFYGICHECKKKKRG